MAEERIDPGGSTEQWRVFAQGSDPAEPKKRPLGPIVIGVLALLIFM